MIRANSKALEDLMKRQLFRGVFRHHYTHISFAAIAYCRQSVIADGGFTVPVWFDFQTPLRLFFNFCKNISLIICVRIPRRVHGLYNEEFFQQQKSREITEEILIKERGVIVGSAYLSFSLLIQLILY